jgi:glycosyltransferase involved in cell wall biosynthesis
MKILVWQWGRFGAGPRFATCLAEGLAGVDGVSVALSLARGAEILRSDAPPQCDLPVATYDGIAGLAARIALAPIIVRRLIRRIRALRPDIAVCALPGPLDLLMAAALRRSGIPFVVVIHDAELHPGDGFPLQMWLQRKLCRRATAVAALTTHVGQRILQQRLAGTRQALLRLRHPPMPYAVMPRHHAAGDTFRLLSFGRLLPYKGLGLLAECLDRLNPRAGLVVRVVGSGPESPELDALRALSGVTVENRWVPENEVGNLLSWADAVVLPYREASQSGVAAAALAAGRHVVATNVGGLAEQLADEPLAILCDPEAGSLANGLRRLLDTPPEARGAATGSAGAAWRELGQSLVAQLEGLLRSGGQHEQASRFIGRAAPGWSD